VQKLLDELGARLKAFVGQREHIALVVRSREEEAPVILKTIEGIDDEATSEMFWIASDEFSDAASWVSAVANAFAVKHGAVRMAMGKEGFEPWPALPDALLDETRRPSERLRDLMIFSRELLPDPGMLVVWTFFPLQIADARGWAALMWELLQHTFPNPWCTRMRIFVRADPADTIMPTALGTIPRIEWLTPDLSQDAMQRAMEDEAADATLPLERRLQNLFMSAGVDYSHSRFPAALSKYAILLKYYAGTQNPTMTAMVLNAIGETHNRQGNPDAATECFELALAPAASAPVMPIPVMLNITLNLANLHMGQGHWEEGEAYYDAAQKLAMAQRDADTRLRAIENLGVCEYAQGKVKEAVAHWHAGAMVAHELEIMEPRTTMLQRLAGHYHQAQDHARYAEVMNALGVPPSTNGGEAAHG
jgi:tetratricopeptide (TPR) repeat protein